MATSKKLTGTKSKDQTSLLVDTHANHLASLENETESTTQDTYGRTSEQPYANYDPITQSWKMCQDISLWEELKYLERLPQSGMTRNGVLYQQADWVPIINVKDSLLWPTPTTHGENTATRIESHARRLQRGMKYSSRLSQAIALSNPHDVGYLNPTWVEWLMGFPTGWTDLED